MRQVMRHWAVAMGTAEIWRWPLTFFGSLPSRPQAIDRLLWDRKFILLMLCVLNCASQKISSSSFGVKGHIDGVNRLLLQGLEGKLCWLPLRVLEAVQWDPANLTGTLRAGGEPI